MQASTFLRSCAISRAPRVSVVAARAPAQHAKPVARAFGAASRTSSTLNPLHTSNHGLSKRGRLLTVVARADASKPGQGGAHSSDRDEPLYLPATASTYCPFSAELLLATTRLGHLERYREEVQQLYEPGQPVDLTRVALLISNIYQPQLDHRPYFEALEYLLSAAALAVMRKVSTAAGGVHVAAGEDGANGFQGLDIQDPHHVLCAVQAINQLLFVEEGLCVNAADPYDPLNGSLADLLDTHKGNQWSLTVVYLYILDGLGLPCAVVGSADRIFIRVGTPPPLVHSDTTTPSPPAALLVDMAQPGVLFAYPPPVPTSSSTLQTAHSVASTSSSAAAAEEWNRSLHAFLQRHTQQQGLDTASVGDAGGNSAEAEGSEPVSPAAASSSSSSTRTEEFAEGGNSDESSSWQELEVYAAQDAATRNSWKALYGPGALTEWGGSVSSNLHYYDSHISSSISDSGSSIGGMGAAEWLGVLDSPFAIAAQQPFPEDDAAPEAAAEDGGELRSFDSMDTSCGSPTGSLDEASSSSSSSTGSTQDGSTIHAGDASMDAAAYSAGMGDVLAVPVLSWADVAAVGGLQPVSKRMVLQQLGGGMKLSLMMSGRQEELLMVLRYLRATDPFSLPDLRDMALCLAEHQPEEAAPLLREYLSVAPGALDADMVGEVLAQVQLRVQLGRAKGWQQ